MALHEYCVVTNDDKHVQPLFIAQSAKYQNSELLDKRIAEGFPPNNDNENAQVAKIVILSLEMLAEVPNEYIFSLFASKNPFCRSIFPIAKFPLLTVYFQKTISQCKYKTSRSAELVAH